MGHGTGGGGGRFLCKVGKICYPLLHMHENLRITKLIKDLEGELEQVPEHREGKNAHYELVDAGMAAFAVFFVQSPSFLAAQREMKGRKGQSNAEKLFGLREIPSDNQIRNLLDPLEPSWVGEEYWRLFGRLKVGGLLDPFRSYEGQMLVLLDGTEYFSSRKIHCENCSQRELQDGKLNYYHSVLTPVIAQPGNKHVIALEPEFIVPQDGQEKQDCEIQAGKRWIEKHGQKLAKLEVTILGDDLYSRQPYCQALRDQQLHFILVCKRESHEYLYESVDYLAAQGVLGTKVVRKWNGKYGEIHTYRYANQLALRKEQPALSVNWCEWTVRREDTLEQLYHNAFITDFEVKQTNVVAITLDGRTRWKIENENNNVLKTKGYHIEHNFGHGQQHLASFLLSLNLLAFLMHTILDLVDEKYQAIRHALGNRRTFFQHLEALLCYIFFDNWDDVFQFMFEGLELDTG